MSMYSRPAYRFGEDHIKFFAYIKPWIKRIIYNNYDKKTFKIINFCSQKVILIMNRIIFPFSERKGGLGY